MPTDFGKETRNQMGTSSSNVIFGDTDFLPMFGGDFSRDWSPAWTGLASEHPFRTTQNDWGAMANAFRVAQRENIDFLGSWLQQVGRRLTTEIRRTAQLKNVLWEGTYIDRHTPECPRGLRGQT